MSLSRVSIPLSVLNRTLADSLLFNADNNRLVLDPLCAVGLHSGSRCPLPVSATTITLQAIDTCG